MDEVFFEHKINVESNPTELVISTVYKFSSYLPKS